MEQLKSLQIVDSAIDRIDGFPGDGSDRIENPVTGDFPGLGYLTLGGDFSDRNAGILAASSVSASGLSSGGQENRVSGRDILLTVVVQESDYEQALRIVEKEGAMV